jgi:hypothetical protein
VGCKRGGFTTLTTLVTHIHGVEESVALSRSVAAMLDGYKTIPE